MLNSFYFTYLCAQIIRASCESAHEETFLKNSFNCTSHFKFFFFFIINCARECISNLRYLRVYEQNFSWICFFLKKARFIRRNHWKLEIFAQINATTPTFGNAVSVVFNSMISESMIYYHENKRLELIKWNFRFFNEVWYALMLVKKYIH